MITAVLCSADLESCTAVPPLLAHNSSNLVPNPFLSGTNGWILEGDAVYDAAVSRSPNSGSIRMTTPYDTPGYSYVYSSGRITISSNKTYTLSAYMRTNVWPTEIQLFGSYRDAGGHFIANISGSLQAVTAVEEWQEITVLFTVPETVNGKVPASFRITIVRTDSMDNSGYIWIDDVYFGEGVSFKQPPNPKKTFSGKYVRLDELGNVELLRNGSWAPFFPMIMYGSTTSERLALWSAQGFNVSAWSGSSLDGLSLAAQAVSAFNPDGMLACFDLAGYCGNEGTSDSYYNNTGLLTNYMTDILSSSYTDHLLFYYWDNENAPNEWTVPNTIIDTVRQVQINIHGTLCQPVYQLQGNEGIARLYNNLSDCLGDYVAGGITGSDPDAPMDNLGLIVMNNIENQLQPVLIGQINAVSGAGQMKVAVYISLIAGARGIGYWRDGDAQPAVENLEWWPEFPDIRREIDALLPVIREPHWTTWSASVSSSSVEVGTREHEGEAYIFAANNSNVPVTAVFSLSGLAYRPDSALDYFTLSRAADISESQFSIVMPAWGTAVYYLPDPTVSSSL